MSEWTHGFTIDRQRCDGCLACMRACPTHAIRIRDGKAELVPERCIDCGLCLTVCRSGAIRATTGSFADLDKYKYKVVVPSPVIFGQFPIEVTPSHIVAALHRLGFDRVWDFAVEMSLVNRAIVDYVDAWEGPYPLLSIACPVIVRLVQVSYPDMIDQLIRIQTPRELAGRELKRKYSLELGIDRNEIGAIYITPCQAKTISILEPAEGARSNLDGALGIADIYNDILALTRTIDMSDVVAPSASLIRSAEMARWSTGGAQGHNLRRHRYLPVTGLSNVIQVFDDIEKGKLRNIEYLECHACWDGCISGNLAVDNIYVTRSKIHRFLSELPETDPTLEAEVERRYRDEDFSLKGQLTPRVTASNTGNLKERADRLKEKVRRMKREEAVRAVLPRLDCGLCGAPTCGALAKDVAAGTARQDQCVFLSDERLRQLRKMYLRHVEPPSEIDS